MKYPIIVFAAIALSGAGTSHPAAHATEIDKLMSDRLDLQASCSPNPAWRSSLSVTLRRNPRSGEMTAALSMDTWSGNAVSWKVHTWYGCTIPADALWVEQDGTVRLEVLPSDGCTGGMWHAYASYMPEPPTAPPLRLSLTGVPDDWTLDAHTNEKWVSGSGRYVAQSRTRRWSVGLTNFGCTTGTVEKTTYQKITQEP
jgi:hypothetical protein